MAAIPETSTTLLNDIAFDTQHARWREFVARYRPMMESFVRERFPSVEADDVIQETFVALCRVLPSYRYAPDEKGHFRNYLTGILRNKALRALQQKQKQTALLEGEQVAATISEWSCCGEVKTTADQSWRDAVFEIALRQFLADESVADRTKRIFERTAIDGESPESVAAAFKMTRHAVDQAKSRAMARLRELVKRLESVNDG